MNVSINSEDGSVVDTLSGRPYKVGWADWGGMERRGFADRYEESVGPARRGPRVDQRYPIGPDFGFAAATRTDPRP